MSNYKEELEEIEKFVTNEKTKEITLKERQRKAKEDKKSLEEKAKELNIAEDKLEETIEELEIEIQQKLSEAKNIISGD